MKIEVTRGTTKNEYDKTIVVGYGEVCFDGKLYIGKSTLKYLESNEKLTKEEIRKVVCDVKKSNVSGIVEFDNY